MFERFIIYLDRQLKEVKDVKEVVELKDELLANLMDKYDELIATGMNQEQAYQEAIKSIGELTEVIEKYQQRKIDSEPSIPKRRGIDLLLYRKDDDYVFDKTIEKLKIINMINFALLFIGLILYQAFAWINLMILGWLIQGFFFVIAIVLYDIFTQKFYRINKQILSTFNNTPLFNQGIGYIRKTAILGSALVFMTFSLSFVSVLYNNLVFCLTLGVLLSIFSFVLIDFYYHQKYHFPWMLKTIITSKIFINFSYLFVVGVLLFQTRPSNLIKIFTVLLVLQAIYDWFRVTKDLRFIYLGLSRSILSLGMCLLLYIYGDFFPQVENNYSLLWIKDYGAILSNFFLISTFIFGIVSILYLSIRMSHMTFKKRVIVPYYLVTIGFCLFFMYSFFSGPYAPNIIGYNYYRYDLLAIVNVYIVVDFLFRFIQFIYAKQLINTKD